MLRQQLVLIFFMDFTAFLVIYLKTWDFRVIRFYIEMLVFLPLCRFCTAYFIKGIPAFAE